MSYQNSTAHIDNANQARSRAIQKNKEMRLQRIAAYNLNPVLCPHCKGAIHYSKAKINKFCSKSCSGYFNSSAKEYSHSNETKKKIKYSLIQTNLKKNPQLVVREGKVGHPKNCQYCKSDFLGKKDSIYCSQECAVRFRSENMTDEQRQKMSKQGRQNIVKQAQSGKWKGWSGRSEPSFPEKYISGLLLEHQIEENFHYRRELPQGGFFVDFAFEKEKIAFEVDGKQHEYPDNKERDQRKDEFLVSQGWCIYRLKWHSVKKELGKKKVHDQFDQIVSIIKKSMNEHHE